MTARDRVVQDHPQTRTDGPSARERAIASAVAAQGAQTPAVVDAPLDVDGDGVADTLFHTESPVLYGIARERSGSWRIDLLPRQTAPQESSAWGPVVPLARGAALLLVRSLRPSPSDAISNQSLEVVVTEPGGEPVTLYTEVYPSSATWTMRAAGAEALELHGIPAAVAGEAPPALHKVLHRVSPTEWRPASCWGTEVRDAFPTAQNCEVATPAGTSERRWELYPGGPPLDADTRVVLLYLGAPPARRRGYENWCVALPSGATNWVYLPSATTAHCTATTPAHHHRAR